MIRTSQEYDIDAEKDLDQQLGEIEEYEMWLRDQAAKKSARQPPPKE